MPLILDLRAQLADRVHRAKALIEYINANGLLSKVSLPFCLRPVQTTLTQRPCSSRKRRGNSSAGTPSACRPPSRCGRTSTRASVPRVRASSPTRS